MEVGLENTPDEATWVHFETKPLKFQNLSNSFRAQTMSPSLVALYVATFK